MTDDRADAPSERGADGSLLQKPVDRRVALGMILGGAVIGFRLGA